MGEPPFFPDNSEPEPEEKSRNNLWWKMIYCTDSHHRHNRATGGVALFCQAAEFTSNKLLSQTWLFLLTFNEVGENDPNITAVSESEN